MFTKQVLNLVTIEAEPEDSEIEKQEYKEVDNAVIKEPGSLVF